jgi:hypothetical protein
MTAVTDVDSSLATVKMAYKEGREDQQELARLN